MNNIQAIKELFKFIVEQEELYKTKISELVKNLITASLAVLAIVASFSIAPASGAQILYPWLIKTSLVLLLLSPLLGTFYLYSLAITHKLAQKKIIDKLEESDAIEVHSKMQEFTVENKLLHRAMFPLCWVTFFLALLSLTIHALVNINP